MIIRKICASLLILFSVALIASYPGGKFYGHYNRKLSKRDQYVGPDRNRQLRQAAWERLQAKKEQKAQTTDASHVILAYCQSVAGMAAASQPATYERHAEHAPRYRVGSAHPFMAAVLIWLMLTAPCATGTLCHDLEDQLHNYMPEYNKFVEYVNSHKEIGQVAIPSVPHTSCPSAFQSTFLFDFGSINEREVNTINSVVKFFSEMSEASFEVQRLVDAYNIRIDDYNKHLDDYNKHLEAASACKEKENNIMEMTPLFDEIRAYAKTNREHLIPKKVRSTKPYVYGYDLLFPEISRIQCPSMENWQQWSIDQADEIRKKAEHILNVYDAHISYFKDLVDRFNKHREAAITCEELALAVATQRPRFDVIREFAQTNANKLGKLVLFPATPRIACPPLKADWDQSPYWEMWEVEDAQNMGQIAKNFLETFNQQIRELNSLVDKYNDSLEGENAVCT